MSVSVCVPCLLSSLSPFVLPRYISRDENLSFSFSVSLSVLSSLPCRSFLARAFHSSSLPSSVVGKQWKMAQALNHRTRKLWAAWLLLGPAAALVVILGGRQQVEDASLCVSLWLTLPLKPIKSSLDRA